MDFEKSVVGNATGMLSVWDVDKRGSSAIASPQVGAAQEWEGMCGYVLVGCVHSGEHYGKLRRCQGSPGAHSERCMAYIT